MRRIARILKPLAKLRPKNWKRTVQPKTSNRPKPNRKATNSPTYYKDSVPPTAYRFSEEPEWFYFDGFHSDKPHLVLRDKTGKARFTLRYELQDGTITIWSIQREHTAMNKLKKAVAKVRKRLGMDRSKITWDPTHGLQPQDPAWNPKAENRSAKKFQAELGMHPAEFLVSEFLYRHREQLARGNVARLYSPPSTIALYRPLVERFFNKPRIESAHDPRHLCYLNLRKERVKRILGVVPNQPPTPRTGIKNPAGNPV